MSICLLKKVNNNQLWPHPPKANLIGYFAGRSSESGTEFYFEENALDLLNYYDKQVDRNNLFTFPAAVESKSLGFSVSQVDAMKNWILQNSELEAVKRARFVTNSEALVYILNFPTSPEKGWELRLKKINEKYYLFNDSFKLFSSTAQNMCLFHKFNCLPSVFSSEAEEFHEVYEVEVGEYRILYAARLPGVKSDKRVTNLDELKAATHLQTAVCNHYYHQFSECRDCIKEWASATLISADQVVIVYKGSWFPEFSNLCGNFQYQVGETTVDQLIATQNQTGTSEALNMPYTAWNYLHDLLTWLESQIRFQDYWSIDLSEKYTVSTR